MSRGDTVERARGRWREILPRLGIETRFLRNKHGPCPLCGGKDRFRFDDKDGRGTWICSVCGAGDGVKLVMAVRGLEFRDAAALIEPLIEGAPRAAAKPGRSEAEKRDAMNRLWHSSAPVRADDPVGRWLFARVGLTRFPSCLRAHPRALYKGKDGEADSRHPAMVAVLQGPDGRPASLHRTYLTADGCKAAVARPRCLMEGKISKGAAVRLMAYADVLGIAEGIETALAAATLFGVPCWAGTNTTILAHWIPPEDAAEIVIFADNDPKYGGQAAAYTLAHRIAVRDRRVRIETPADAGTDWNDVLIRRAFRGPD
jgi:putative DNA primase/helicase